MSPTRQYVAAFVAMLFFLLPSFAFATAVDGTIDVTSKYAWGDEIGWVNFGTTGGNVRVTDAGLTGYAWADNLGWIKLAPSGSGVTNNSQGDLSGSAWGENIGWIDFASVSIGTDGIFSGYATTSALGQISFNCANTSSCASSDFKVKTDWRPLTERNRTNQTRPGSSPIVVEPTVCSLLSPLEGQTLTFGTTVTIRWDAQGGGIAQAVLSSSVDGGAWQPVATLPASDARYDWLLPESSPGSRLRLQLDCRNSAGSTVSSALVSNVLAARAADAVETGTGTAGGAVWGAHARSPILSTVYFYDPVSRTRRPYLNEQTYFTHEQSFDAVEVVTVLDLASIPLGPPMLPKVGTVFVKLQSVPTVYVTEEVVGDGTRLLLRAIPDETTAAALAGSHWADYVIDMPVTVFPRMRFGEDVSSTYQVDQASLIRRIDLRARSLSW